ncbi:hypothetical protein [Nonomuraea sp. JJY05]|uniref:hypothetical protein n=1 Tax=Nonomuraea sp. JJY05 TaxID=3350255 RepID=UPI00373ED5A4
MFNVVGDPPLAREWVPHRAGAERVPHLAGANGAPHLPGAERAPHLTEAERAPHLTEAERVAVWRAPVPGRQVVVTMMSEGRGISDAGAKRELGPQLRQPSWQQDFKEELV